MAKKAVNSKNMIKQDYKTNKNRIAPHHFWLAKAKLHWGETIAIAFGILLLGVALTIGDDSEELDSTPVISITQELEFENNELGNVNLSRKPLELQWQNYPDAIDPENPTIDDLTESKKAIQENTVQVKSGDTLSSIFSKQGFSARDVYEITQDPLAKEYLTRIRPGKELIFKLDEQGQLLNVHYLLSINETLQIKKTANGYHGELKTRPIEIRQAFASGIIDDSLFNAGKKQGLSDTLIVKLANIFGWDIDFALDVRKNDSFAMIYEQKYLDDELIGEGEILVAQFVNQGEVFQAVRYVEASGSSNYYSPTGDSMRKAFLRSPVNFMYISSNFNPNRYHPILKRYKAHNGIDYRAKTGTPVYAAGDGKVIASSFNQYNGKYIFIQHGNNITTKYLHLSKRTVANGKRVKQGQVIGYVGATGMAEAPHLHYEFVVNGAHRNPRTVKLPQAEPIAKSEKDRFIASTQPLLSGLEARTRLLP